MQKPAPAKQSPSVFLLSRTGFKRSFEICLLICFPLMAATKKSFQPEKVKLSQTILVHSKHTNWLFFKNKKLTICFAFRSGITYSKGALALNHPVCVHGCACAGVGGCVCVCMTVLSPLCLAVTLEQGQCNGGQWSQSPLQSPKGRDSLLRTLEREVYSTDSLREDVWSPRKHREDFYKESSLNNT